MRRGLKGLVTMVEIVHQLGSVLQGDDRILSPIGELVLVAMTARRIRRIKNLSPKRGGLDDTGKPAEWIAYSAIAIR